MEKKVQNIPAPTSRPGQVVLSIPRQNFYKVFPYRWTVLFAYFFTLFLSGATYSVFIPFSSFLQRVYGISHVFVVLTAFTFNGIYPLSSFLIADRFIGRFGVGGIVVCLWMRTMINVWVYMINIASLLGAIFNPLQCNLITKIAVNWFPPSQHVAATITGSVASLLGSALGPFYILALVDTSKEDISEARTNIFYSLVYIAATYTAIYAVCIFLYKDKPIYPPCPDSVESDKSESTPIKAQLKALVTSKDFLIYLIDYNLVLYIVVALGSNISPFFTTFGIRDTLLMVSASAGFLLAGLIGCFIVSLVMAKFPHARIVLFICIISGAVFHILTFIAFSEQIVALMISFPVLMGFFLIPVKGLLLSCCCGVTNQATEHVINGFVLSTYSAGSIIVALGTAVLAEMQDQRSLIIYAIATTCVLVVCACLVFFAKGILDKF